MCYAFYFTCLASLILSNVCSLTPDTQKSSIIWHRASVTAISNANHIICLHALAISSNIILLLSIKEVAIENRSKSYYFILFFFAFLFEKIFIIAKKVFFQKCVMLKIWNRMCLLPLQKKMFITISFILIANWFYLPCMLLKIVITFWFCHEISLLCTVNFSSFLIARALL